MSELSDQPPARGHAPSRSLGIVGFITSVVGAVVIVAALAGMIGVLAGWRPSLNLFSTKATDRTGSPVLRTLTDLSEYHAASGHYETVVDLVKDTNHLPGWVSGERLLYVGKGDVDAVVDFGELDERRVAVSDDAKSLTVELPAPTVEKPVLDLETSYVVEHDKGLVNRFKGSEIEREAQLKAINQMTAAATGEDLLLDQAKENTAAMLRGLFGSLGYTSITISFEESPD